MNTRTSVEEFTPDVSGYLHVLIYKEADTSGQRACYRELMLIEGTKTQMPSNWMPAIEDLSGSDGVGLKSVDVMYYLSTSNTTLTGGSWATVAPAWVNGRYYWSKTVFSYTNGDTDETQPVCISGGTGSSGKGISSIVEQYYRSTSNTTPTGGTWSTTVPAWANGYYMWTRSVITYTDATSTTTNPVCVSGSKGQNGDDGVGISSITEYYLATSSNSGVITSTSGWTTAIQLITADKRYLWNYEVVTYTDGKKTTTVPVIIGVWGDKGVGISSITEYYLASSSQTGVTTSTSGWTTTVQTTTTTNRYLWNYEKVTYTDGTSWTSPPVVIGTQGTNGANGTNGKDGSNGKDGAKGTDARLFEIEPNDGAVTSWPDGSHLPSSIVFSSYYRDGASTTRSNYAGRLQVQASTNGTSWTTVTTASANSYTTTSTLSTIKNVVPNAKFIKCNLYAAGGTTTLIGALTIPIITSNANHLTSNNAGLFVHEKEGELNYDVGSYLRLLAGAMQICESNNILIELKKSLVSFLSGQGYMGLSDITPLGEKTKSFEFYADSTRGLTFYSAGTNGVRLIDNSSDLKKSTAMLMQNGRIQLAAGNSSSSEFGSGAWMAIDGPGRTFDFEGKRISFNGNDIFEPFLLWSGAHYMNASQTANFSKNLTNQFHGIILVWSSYTDGVADGWNWNYHVVPKNTFNYNTGSGSAFFLVGNGLTSPGYKYLYINNTRIAGHANNNTTGTASGIAYKNNRWVLRYVYGF